MDSSQLGKHKRADTGLLFWFAYCLVLEGRLIEMEREQVSAKQIPETFGQDEENQFALQISEKHGHSW